MKDHSYTAFRTSFYFIAIVFTFLACDSDHKQEEGKSWEEYGPAEYLWERWTYPNETFDHAYFSKVLKKAQVENTGFKDGQNEVNWRMEGPYNIGGRINVVALNPDDEDEIWIGSAAGGVFKSINAGDSWVAIGESFAYMSIGSIAFDPTNTSTVYVGTGDPNISGYPKTGEGVYKTIDGGITWEHLGPTEVGVVSTIIVDPLSSETIYMSSMGTPYYESDDRGIYKSMDGGETWEQKLFLADSAGISYMVMHPTMPDTLYAAGWDRIRSNTKSIVSGNHSRIYRSYDGGTSWDTLAGGLPQEYMSRAAIDISISDPSVLYASFVDDANMNFYGVYRSQNNGDTWTDMTDSNLVGALGGFGWYFGMIRIDPSDDSFVSLGGVELHSTNNNGNLWYQSTPNWWLYEVHADMHDMKYASNGDIYLATDGGLYRSEDDMLSWDYISYIPITQFYRIAVNPHLTEVYSGGAQDNGTTEGNYEDLEAWPRIYGGDGFQSIYDPEEEEIFYTTTQNGNFHKYDFGSWNSFNEGIDNEDRVSWDAPLIMSAFDSDIFYTGTSKVYKSDGSFWTAISDDLNGPLDYYPANRYVITTIAESPLNEDVVYAGTSDGKVWVTENGGADWADISSALPDRYVTNIKASSFLEGMVYITLSGYKDGDDVGHVYRSDDYGQTWESIAGDLADFGLNHIEILNNNSDSILFVASDGGVYYSINYGVNWERAGDNMPIILVFDIEIDYDANRLVAGTFSRSMQSLSLDSLLDFSTAIKEYAKPSFTIYPNPVMDELNVRLNVNNSDVNWHILDLNGKEIESGRHTGNAINVSSLSSGVYFIAIESNTSIEIKKWIKQ